MNAAATTNAMGVVNFASGALTGDGTAITVTLGFTPRFVKVVNVSDVETWEAHEGMAAGTAIKTVTAGTTTVVADGSVTLTDNGFTLASAEFGSADVITWVAFG